MIIAWGDHPKGLKDDYNELVAYALETLNKNENNVFYVDKISKNGNPKHGQVWSYSDELKKRQNCL